MADAAANQEAGLDLHNYTKDGTVDWKGNTVLRSKTGRWKACSFILGYELIERMMFHGISSNLIIYLTTKLNQGTLTASNNVTNWSGTVWTMPIIGAYVADAHLGRYRTFFISSLVCFMAMTLLTAAVSIPSLKPPPCSASISRENCKQASKLQLAVFFGSLYLLAIASGGTKPNISTMGADQFDDFDPKEKAQKLSFFNWWLFTVFSGILFASTILVYIQDNVGWSLGYGIPTIGLGVAILIFVVGTPFYRHKPPNGSPFITMANVFVAAIWNWRLPLPNDPNQLHELDLQNYSKNGTFKIDSTPSLRFLNKAAIRRVSSDPWRICTVTEVEETKQMVRMIPIMVCSFIPSAMVAQTHTLFIKQGTTLNRSIGSHFKVPPASLYAFVTISMLLTILIYDRIFLKIMQRVTKNPRGITMLQRMGIGMICHVLVMTVASQVEKHRLHIAAKYGSSAHEQKELPLTIFILLPQFILTGVADAFLLIANNEFFYDQAPENMKSLGSSYFTTSLGIGNFLSTFILSKVSEITKRQGNGWILNNLNSSHLNYFYALLAVMSSVNFFLFLLISKFYVYKAEVSDSIQVLTDELKKKKSKA
ncbi:protein NRT1/ PTR FAMILY 5.2-like [Cucumis melo var. makuwa]|uniref:Protein NRT1/ PTR FAMILY 5.2-like n=1 Tax=Cucumis melo var. makuwa TaxID=1194695 RepID=A0A5A7U6G8_CUCMM|nr:protein NRT1/ PTR FAMILY 5.2-like [Cucumis melo var. makuwa]